MHNKIHPPRQQDNAEMQKGLGCQTLLVEKFSTKKIVMLFDVISQMLFAFIYFVPFVPIDPNAKKLIVVASIMISQVCKTMVITLYYKWGNSYVHDEKRAQFSAMKECISLITGIVFVAVVSFVFDKFKAFDNTEGGLLFIACTMAVLNVANYISFALIKDEPKRERESMRVPTKEVIGHIASNKIFRNYVLINMFGATTGAFISGFLGVYKIQELGMSLFLVQVINIVADFFRMGVVWDRFMPRDTILIADVAHIAPLFQAVPEKGVIFEEQLAKTGASDMIQIYSQIGLAHGPAFLHGSITNLAVA
jgi:hypothetical protein